MNKLYIYVLFLFLAFKMEAQELIYGFYENYANNEFICIQEDTILFKFYNNDAFGTYTFYYGAYEYDNQQLKLKRNIVSEMTSSIEKAKNDTNDSISVKLLNYDDSPMLFTSVSFINPKEKDVQMQKYTDDNGELFLFKDEINEFLFKNVLIKVESLGYSTEHLIPLNTGDYLIIKSLIPNDLAFLPFNGNKLKCFINKENEIIITYSKRKTLKLRKKMTDIEKCGFELFK